MITDLFTLNSFVDRGIQLELLASFRSFEPDNDVCNCFSIPTNGIARLMWRNLSHFPFINFLHLCKETNQSVDGRERKAFDFFVQFWILLL